MSKPEKNIIAYVSSIPQLAIERIREHEKKTGDRYRILLIRDKKIADKEPKTAKKIGVDLVTAIDFNNPKDIQEKISKYKDELLVITSRNESKLSDFMEIIPYLEDLRVPSVESLEKATDKILMRRAFTRYDKTITPVYAVVKNTSKEERQRIIKKIGFPIIVKPANLAASLLVSICYHEEELEKVIKKNFSKIKSVYKENDRLEDPRLLAEEFMEGKMYSVDGYVSNDGNIAYCPMVYIKPAKEIGVDDFYPYLEVTPTGLSRESIKRAHEVVQKGVDALDLRNTTVHVELMRTNEGWKIIEIGARIGGARDAFYMLCCDINHTMNDLLNRMGKKVILPKKCARYVAGIMYFPRKEGVITKMTGIKKLESLASYQLNMITKKKGDICKFAKNGGKKVFNLVLANSNRPELLADIRRVEKMVNIEID